MKSKNTSVIALFGMSAHEVRVLHTICALSKNASNVYMLQDEAPSELPDVSIVDKDSPAAMDAWQRFEAINPATPVIMVSRQPGADPTQYEIRRPLMATRLLRLLDEIGRTHERSAFVPSRTTDGGAGAEVSSATPRVEPQAAPRLEPQAAPRLEPRAAPRLEPRAAPRVGSQAAPRLEPRAAPRVGPQAAPRLEPRAAPRVAPRLAPQVEQEPVVHRLEQAAQMVALVVDDSLPVRRQISLELAPFAKKVDLAEDGERAVELIESKHYDIVFLDVVLPGMDGYAICKRIKRDKRTKKTPVIMLTGKSSPFDRVKGKLAGCDTYLTKPVDPLTFEKTVRKYVTKQQAREPIDGRSEPTGGLPERA